jgi:nucleoid-associated protein YgaU
MVPYADFSIPSVLYKIARGDSLRKIAKKYYGSEDYWKKIFDDNRDVVKKANLIYPGRVLKLFAVDLGNSTYLVPNENGGSIVPATVPVPTGENSNQTNAGTQEASAADSEVNQPTVTKYVVAKGDTLSRIAKRVYGKSTDWSRIYDANRDQIPNPNLIYPGQQLNIPQ